MRRSSVPERLAALCTGLLLSQAAGAFVLRHLDASCVDGVYRVTLDADVDAPAAKVGGVLTDFPAYRALDPRILDVESLGMDGGGGTLLRTRVRACAGIFCRSVNRVERIVRGPGELIATVDPGRSDLRRGETRTLWSAEDGGRTRVHYQSEFVPGFWVPAFVGQRLVLRTLRESTLQLFRNVERRAREPGAGH